MAADQAQKASDPNNNPARFHDPTDLARVHPVPNQLQGAILVPGSLTAEDAKQGTKFFQRRSIRAPGTELLDSNNKAM